MTPEASKVFSKYLSVPFVSKGRDTTGWDCFGLYRYVLAARFGILVPSYAEAYDNAENDPRVCKAISNYRPLGWLPVPMGSEREGDGVVFCIGGVPWHCGYVIEPGIMLHARRGCGTAIETYLGWVWQKRIEGIYRCKL